MNKKGGRGGEVYRGGPQEGGAGAEEWGESNVGISGGLIGVDRKVVAQRSAEII